MISHSSNPAFQPLIPISSVISPYVIPKCSGSFLVAHHRTSTLFYPKPVRFPHPSRSKQASKNLRCVVKGWDTMTASEFDERESSSSLAICFVGMSNCGKSYWSQQLKRKRGFHVVSVDEEIESAIKPELSALGYAGINGMAEWMGFPSDNRFAKNQSVYLGYEESITARTSPQEGSNSVLDTTGSVIYLKSKTLGRIRSKYLIVHLEASDDMLEFMTKNYFEMPKPVVWGDAYLPLVDEEPVQAMRRCYPNLLRERRKKYAALAHVTVPATLSLSRKMKLDEFLQCVKSGLR